MAVPDPRMATASIPYLAGYALAVHAGTQREQVSGMRMERIEVRLDRKTREKLEEAAAERIGQMEVEDAPEPAELKRQLSEL